jgi:hypothetical protein
MILPCEAGSISRGSGEFRSKDSINDQMSGLFATEPKQLSTKFR